MNLSIYSEIYQDCQKLQAEWLEELNSFRYSNRAEFKPNNEQKNRFRTDLHKLLTLNLGHIEGMSELELLGYHLHFEARMLPSTIFVSKALYIYYSPELTTTFSFIKIIDSILYDQIVKGELTVDNISETLINEYIDALNCMNFRPFNENFIEEIQNHYHGIFMTPLIQSKLPVKERLVGLNEKQLKEYNNMESCILNLEFQIVNHSISERAINIVREKKFTFSKNSWDKLSNKDEFYEVVSNFTPEDHDHDLVIELPTYKPMAKSNINNALSKKGQVFRAMTYITDLIKENATKEKGFNELDHIRSIYFASVSLERNQFENFDSIAVKEQNTPLGYIGALFEIVLSNCFKSFEDDKAFISFYDKGLMTNFNSQIFTRTLYNNACLVSPYLSEVQSIHVSMDQYAEMYHHFFHQKEIKEMLWAYINIARIPDLVLNRENYQDTSQ